jgi:hypothetical protein
MLQVKELEQQSKAADIELRKTASEILRAHDKLLMSLQTLASDLDPISTETDHSSQRERDLCARYVASTVVM